jgi:tryptophanyl-tRNA synthetase
MSLTRVLTGITTSGIPHLGNYVGAIRPAVAASRMPGNENFYFLADMHALIKVQDPAKVQRSTLEIAASWLACGLEPDNDRVWFYRQSDIIETSELTWFLTCVAGKGILNRAHAYKAAVDKNRADGEDDDFGITAGLFMYPVLMAADIVIFGANRVPVGRDQIQHIEMARDFAQRFNHLYGDHLVLPEAVVEEHVATLPGLDGRKMSKSYDNTIPLFCSREQLKKLIFSIVTDSRAPGDPKDTDGSALFQLYQAFASAEETAAMRGAYAQGIGWGDAKQQLFERIDAELAPMRERYEALMAAGSRATCAAADAAFARGGGVSGCVEREHRQHGRERDGQGRCASTETISREGRQVLFQTDRRRRRGAAPEPRLRQPERRWRLGGALQIRRRCGAGRGHRRDRRAR